MKNSIATTRSQLPASGSTHKMFSSQRSRLLDEFLRFRHPDGSAATLNMSIEEPDGKSGIRFALSWGRPHDYPQKMLARFDPSNRDALFVWEGEREALSGYDSQWALPFEDDAFDWVFCEALLEHAGSYACQYLLLKELTRVARKGIFVTTSNRWHPVELHTGLPLLHWLPGFLWKPVLKRSGKQTWASASTLNLLGAKTLERFAEKLAHPSQYSIGHIRIFGFKAYFFLQIRKTSAAASRAMDDAYAHTG